MSNLGSLDDMDAFIRVARAGSLTAAAAELEVPKSTISRRVARLEAALGVALLNRTGRSVSLTEHGNRLFHLGAPALAELTLAQQHVRDEATAPRGSLRITAPHDLGSTRAFGRLLAAYRRHAPEVTLDVQLSARTFMLADEGFDLGFRLHRGQLQDSVSLVSRRIAEISTGLFASPAYLRAAGHPTRRDELSTHAWVVHALTDLEVFWLGNRAKTLPPMAVVVRANDFALALGAVLEGVGIGMIPRFLAAPHVDDGELVPVLPRLASPTGHLSLVWPASRFLSARVRDFVDFVGRRATTRALLDPE